MNNVRGLIVSLQVYIKELNTPYDVKSTSHYTLRYLYDMYTEDVVDSHLKKYWNIKYRRI